jgi:hypothetical protein
MHEADWESFIQAGVLWQPPMNNTIPLITTFPGDVLLLLPGNHNVYGPIILSTCVQDGGIFWDVRCMHAYNTRTSPTTTRFD